MQFLTTYFKQRAWNIITLASTLLQPILVTALILAGLGIEGVLLGIVITPLVGLALAAWQAMRAAREIEPGPADRPLEPALRGRFARYAAVTYLMQISTWFYDIEVVVFLATAVLDLGQVAVLGFAYKLAKDLLGYVWTPLTGVMTPLLARIKERRSDTALEEAVGSLTRMIWLLVVPAGVGLVLLAPRLVEALYPKYAAGIGVILVFIVFTFLESLLSVPHNVLMVYELYRPVILSRLVAFLSVPLVILALPRYGLMGVAVTVGVVRVAARVVTVIACRASARPGAARPFRVARGLCERGLRSRGDGPHVARTARRLRHGRVPKAAQPHPARHPRPGRRRNLRPRAAASRGAGGCRAQAAPRVAPARQGAAAPAPVRGVAG
jgi:O-antigen/teichoic acid export membrane protein